MQRYILRRLIIAVPVMFIISIMTFGFANAVPGDPVSAMADPEMLKGAGGDALRERLGLDKSVPVRYGIWLREILTGNLGYSYHSGEPDASILAIASWSCAVVSSAPNSQALSW